MNNKTITFTIVIIIAAVVIVTLIYSFSTSDLHTNKENRIENQMDIGQIGFSKESKSNVIDSQVFRDNSTKTDQCKGSAKCISGLVTRIIDGDTIVVDDKSIRFSLVNTPEWGDKDYFHAGAYIETVCPIGSKVVVDEDDGQTQGSFGRIIGKIYCNRIILNEEILESGYAVILTKFCSVSEFANEPWAKKFGC